jgi:hypothetical protein
MSEPQQRERGPQWVNSYESQLSDADLLWLHAALLARKPSDKEIIRKLPPWKNGPRKGLPVSAGTLSNIRDRLQAEEDFRDVEASALELVNQRKERDPQLSEAELEEYGQRVFTELTVVRQDLKGFVKLRTARNKAVLEKAKLDLKEQELALARDKFREELRTSTEKALAALAEEIKGNAKAEAALQAVYAAMESPK